MNTLGEHPDISDAQLEAYAKAILPIPTNGEEWKGLKQLFIDIREAARAERPDEVRELASKVGKDVR